MNTKEFWFNVYSNPSKVIFIGSRCYDSKQTQHRARQAIANGCKLLYRIHVKLKQE